jgi:hypothetical protein
VILEQITVGRCAICSDFGSEAQAIRIAKAIVGE